MTNLRFSTVRAVAAGALWLSLAAAANAARTQNVVLIVSDGLRWQEIFTGAEEDLLNEKNGGSWLSEKELRNRYWRPSAEERRMLLFPFLWGTVAKSGQLIGNQTLGSVQPVCITNPLRFLLKISSYTLHVP